MAASDNKLKAERKKKAALFAALISKSSAPASSDGNAGASQRNASRLFESAFAYVPFLVAAVSTMNRVSSAPTFVEAHSNTSLPQQSLPPHQHASLTTVGPQLPSASGTQSPSLHTLGGLVSSASRHRTRSRSRSRSRSRDRRRRHRRRRSRSRRRGDRRRRRSRSRRRKRRHERRRSSSRDSSASSADSSDSSGASTSPESSPQRRRDGRRRTGKFRKLREDRPGITLHLLQIETCQIPSGVAIDRRQTGSPLEDVHERAMKRPRLRARHFRSLKDTSRSRRRRVASASRDLETEKPSPNGWFLLLNACTF